MSVPLSLFPPTKNKNKRQIKEKVIRNAWDMGQNELKV